MATVSFGDAMDTLSAMFSHVHPDRIRQILQSHGGVMERAVDTLLQIPDDGSYAGPPASRMTPHSSGNSHAMQHSTSHQHRHRHQSQSQSQSQSQNLYSRGASTHRSSHELEVTIRNLEILKQTAIQREAFLEAEDLKNRIRVLRQKQQQALNRQTAEAEAARAAAAQQARRSPFATDFDELTPIFLRTRSRRSLRLPETFLRSPGFRKAAIENKILASGLALQLNDEDMQAQRDVQSQSSRQSAGTSRPEPRRGPNKAQSFFKNLGEKAKQGFQKFKESLKKKPERPRAASGRRRDTADDELLIDDGLSPRARARAESNQEYAAMGDDGEFDPFKDDTDTFGRGLNTAAANRNRMLWKMNRKPAASVQGFELKDIGSSCKLQPATDDEEEDGSSAEPGLMIDRSRDASREDPYVDITI